MKKKMDFEQFVCDVIAARLQQGIEDPIGAQELADIQAACNGEITVDEVVRRAIERLQVEDRPPRPH